MFDLVWWPFDLITVAFLGLCFGSCATAITYRELNDLPWLFPAKANNDGNVKDIKVYRSVCPNCHHVLSVLDLVPVLSWAFLRGKCRYCKHDIDCFYPLIELLTLLACAALYAVYGWTISSAFMMFSVPFLVALIVVDFQRMLLPNSLVAILAILGVLVHVFPFNASEFLLHAGGAILSGFVYSGFLLLLAMIVSNLLKKEALGGGDVKFFFVAGLWLGLDVFPIYCILSGLIGVCLGVVWRTFLKSDIFPFGPALIMSLYFLWLFDGSFLTELL